MPPKRHGCLQSSVIMAEIIIVLQTAYPISHPYNCSSNIASNVKEAFYMIE